MSALLNITNFPSSDSDRPVPTDWTSPVTISEYIEAVNETIGSDLPAYVLSIFRLLGVGAESNVLDVGCLDGKMTKLLKIISPAHIGAVDMDKEVIDVASKKNTDSSITYMYSSPSEQSFPLIDNKPYSAAFVGFVIPTINNISSLVALCRKIYNSLRTGGQVSFLLLNPEAVKKGAEYKNYKLSSDKDLKNGETFDNKITTNVGKEIILADTYWEVEVLKMMLRGMGFVNVSAVPITAGRPDVEDVANNAFIDELTRQGLNIDSPEFSNSGIPLYLNIVATKSHKTTELRPLPSLKGEA